MYMYLPNCAVTKGFIPPPRKDIRISEGWGLKRGYVNFFNYDTITKILSKQITA